MNKLSALITELCPNGVEYVPLWSVTIWDKRFNSVDRIKQPTAITYPYLLAADLFAMQQENGDVFLLSTGEQTGWTTEEIAGKYLCTGEVVTMPWGKTRPVADCAKYYRGKFVTADNRIMTSNNTSVLDNKYLYYWFISVGKVVDTFYRGSGIQHPDMAKVLDLQIPLPPLEVQREIVRILDTFTELTAELTARKQQYAYYRNKLLTFNIPGGTSRTTWRKFGETCFLQAGKAINAENISKEKTPEYCIPCYGGNGLRGYVREANQQGDKPLIGRQGALCGNVCFAKGDYYATEHAVVVTDQGFYNSRFLYHLLVNKNLNQYKTSGAQPGLSVAKLETILLPVPEIEIQKRIADVLDNFDAICSDLNIGLPAEIEARKKQYEFYRDQLLTFAAQDEIVLTDRQTDRQTDEYNALIRLCQYVFGYISIELGSIGKVSMCKRIMKAETAPNGDVPFYKIGTFGKTPDAYISREKFEEYRKAYSFPKKGDVLISAAGTIGRTVIYDGEDAYYQDSNIVWVDNDESIVLNRYLFYCYQLQPWAVSEGGTIARLYNDNISKAKIKVPSIAEQKRIIAILDHFSTLCTDLTSGLPAEIEARKKQYEYYRDNLLSFTPAD